MTPPTSSPFRCPLLLRCDLFLFVFTSSSENCCFWQRASLLLFASIKFGTDSISASKCVLVLTIFTHGVCVLNPVSTSSSEGTFWWVCSFYLKQGHHTTIKERTLHGNQQFQTTPAQLSSWPFLFIFCTEMSQVMLNYRVQKSICSFSSLTFT